MLDMMLVNVNISNEEMRDFIYQNVSARLISDRFEWNKKLVEENISIPYLDLRILFEVRFNMHGDVGSFLINNLIAKRFNLDIKKLYENALEKEASIFSLDDIMKKCHMLSPDELEYKMQDDYYEQYVLTNEEKLFGAGMLINPKALAKASEICGGDMVILPSSVHEVLFMRYDEKFPVSFRDLKDMVLTVNYKDVKKSEWLSESVYYYNAETGLLGIVA